MMARGDHSLGDTNTDSTRSSGLEQVIAQHKSMLSQTEPIDCLSGYHRHVEILVACRHKTPRRLMQLISERLDTLHPLLATNLSHVLVPAIGFGEQMAALGFDPEQETACDATAADHSIIFWGEDQLIDLEYSLSPECFEHELAHLDCDQTGVPDGLAQVWEQARAEDAACSSSIAPYPDGIRGFPVDQGVTRMMLTETDCVSNYVVGFDDPWKRRSEDWADSVSLYLSSLRHQGLHYQQQCQLFADHYPHRATVLDEYFRRPLPAVPERVPRSDQPAI